MNSFYLYAYYYKEVVGGTQKETSATVIFCSCDEINDADLQSEIKTFYQQHYQTEKIFAIGSSNNVGRLTEVFVTKQDKTFIGIPKRQNAHLKENLFLLSFDKDGKLKCENGKTIPAAFKETFINEGLQQIFISRGGLITSEASHHYVFPSGKHCDRFLRTGNILLYSPEIFFIAFSLLSHFDESKYRRIYCDTSSINSIAFALFDLKNNFLRQKINVSIESFSSYEGLYKRKEPYTLDSFLLISASTSANIIKYILDKQRILHRDNMVILYFLAESTDYSNVRDQVLCNLAKSDTNPKGIPTFTSYTEKNCEFCKRGSYAVPVSGDVFLLEKPKVNKILLTTGDREKGLSDFAQQFLSVNKGDSILRSHYKERSDNKYGIYIDYRRIISEIGKAKFSKHKEKLDYYIQQYIPSNTKYLLHLNDEGSAALVSYINTSISPAYTQAAQPKILSIDDIGDIPTDETGAIVIVGSCISNGKNLLYISRALRRCDKLRILYFVGIARTSNKELLLSLKKNLTMGRFGLDTNGFIAVETLYCNNESRFSPWLIEIDFLESMGLYIQDEKPQFAHLSLFFDKRKQILLTRSGDTEKGITQELYYERILPTTREILYLRKNFAFWDFDNYDDHATQSDVFFTISNILNTVRNSDKPDRQLSQTVYVRNLLDPSNFNRFNDGIIQASLLRAANADELAYSIDEEISQEIYNILETILDFPFQEQGEALLEFLYAIAIKKLSLAQHHLSSLLDKLEESSDDLFKCFGAYIKFKIIEEPERVKRRPLLSTVQGSDQTSSVVAQANIQDHSTIPANVKEAETPVVVTENITIPTQEIGDSGSSDVTSNNGAESVN